MLPSVEFRDAPAHELAASFTGDDEVFLFTHLPYGKHESRARAPHALPNLSLWEVFKAFCVLDDFRETSGGAQGVSGGCHGVASTRTFRMLHFEQGLLDRIG